MPLPAFRDVVSAEAFKSAPPERRQELTTKYWDQFEAENPDAGDYVAKQREDAAAYIGAKIAAEDAAPVERRFLERQAKVAGFNFYVREQAARNEIDQEGLDAALAERQRLDAETDTQLEKTRSLFDPAVQKAMQPAFEALQLHAARGGKFGSPRMDAWLADALPGGEKDAIKSSLDAYGKLRGDIARDFHISEDELDDVVKHQMDAQTEAVSRDAFGTPHIKNEVLAQGPEAAAAAINNSTLPWSVKQKLVKDLPERIENFKKAVVEGTTKNHPELAEDLGLNRQVADPSQTETRGNLPAGYRYATDDEKFAKITAALNAGKGSQTAGGALAGLLGTAEFAPGATGEDAAVGRRRTESINQLSSEINTEKVKLWGTDASVFGQGAYSLAESFAVGALTAGAGAPIAAERIARMGAAGARMAKGFNAASRVAPIAGLAATKQGFQTYEQAIEGGKTPEEAGKLALTSAAIEFGLTVGFSAVGMGGLEDAATPAAREAVKAATKTGFANFGGKLAMGIAGEELEELSIAALDAAAVQAKLNPGMTVADFQKTIKDTALVTLFAAGAATTGRSAIESLTSQPTYEQSTAELEARANLALAESAETGPADPVAAGGPPAGDAAPLRAVDPAADGTPELEPPVGDSGLRDVGQESAETLAGSEAVVPSVPESGRISAGGVVSPPADKTTDEIVAEGEEFLRQREAKTPPASENAEQSDAEWIAERKAASAQERRAKHAEAGPLGERLNEIETKWGKRGVEVIPTMGKDHFELTVLSVPEADRGKGLGSEVLNDLKKAADESGKPLVLLANDIEQTGRHPGEFYEKNGFTATGKNKYRYEPQTPQSDEETQGQGRQEVLTPEGSTGIPADPAAPPEVVEKPTVAVSPSKTDVEDDQPVDSQPVKSDAVAENPQEPSAPSKVTSGEETVGTRHAKTEEIRKELGLPERAESPPQDVADQWGAAKAEYAEDPAAAPRAIIRSVAEKPRPLTAKEELVMLQAERAQRDKVRKANKALAAGNDDNRVELLAKAEEAEAYMLEILDTVEKAGSEWGRTGVARQQELKEDFSLERMLASEQKTKGRKLTDTERKEVTEIAEKLAKIEQDVAAAREEIASAAAEDTFKQQTREFKKEAKESKARGEKPQSFLERQAEAARQRILERKRQGRLQANLDPADITDHAIVMLSKGVNLLKDLGAFTAELVKEFGAYVKDHAPAVFKRSQELAKQATPPPSRVKSREGILSGLKPDSDVTGKVVYDLARAHINEGVEGFENVMAAVLADLKSTYPDLTLRQVHDAYSGYGKVKFPSKDEDKVKLREYRTLARLTSQLEDAQRKLAPLKTGPQRDAATERVRRLQRDVREEMRRQNIKPRSNAANLRSGLDSLKARLRNSIEDLEAAIRDRKRIENARTPVEADAEAKALQDRRDALRKDYDAIFGKKTLSDFERARLAVRALNKQIAFEEDLLAKGLASRPATGPQSSAWSPEIADLKAKLDGLRENRAKLRKALRPQRDPVEVAAERLQKHLERRVQTKRDIVKTGNLKAEGPQPAKPQVTPTSEMKALLREETLLDELVAEIRASEPPSAETEARQRQALLKRLNDRLADLNRRIRTNDLATKPKAARTPSSDPVVAKVQQEIARQQDTLKFLKKVFKERKNPEQVRLDRQKKVIATRIQKIRNRIAADDYAPRPKKPPVSGDKALDDLRREEIATKKAFNERLLKAQLDARSKWEKSRDFLYDILGVPRALMTSADFGAVLRQGGFLTLGDPARLARNLPANFKAFWSEKGADKIDAAIQKDHFYPQAIKAGLYLAERGDSHVFTKLEEAYRSRLAKKIPFIGRIVTASERAYTGYLNALRMDTFSRLARSLSLDGNLTDEGAKTLANFVNIATGRGDLGKSEGATQALAAVFFSPKYVASRFQLIYGAAKATGDALSGFQAGSRENRAARKLVAKEYAKFLIGVGTVYGLVRAMAGLLYDDDDKDRPTISLDPRSSDFAKIKIGKTRIDLMAGLSQTTTFLSRLKDAGARSIERGFDVTPGKLAPVEKPQPFKQNFLWRFLRSKLAPLPSTAVNFFDPEGKDVTGNKVTPETELLGSLLPLSAGDIVNAIQEQGVPRGTALGLLGIFGAGVQTYGDGVKPMEQQLFEKLGVPPSRYTEVKAKAAEKLKIPRVKVPSR